MSDLFEVINFGKAELLPSLCLEQRYLPFKCQKCVAVCPTRAVFRDGEKITINKEECLNCGFCKAVCPTGAISLSGVTPLKAVAEVQEESHVGCALNPANTGKINLPCYGFLDAGEIAILAAAGKKLNFYLESCKDCSYSRGKELFQQNLEVLKKQLGNLPGFTIHERGRPPKDISRREFFSFLTGKLKTTTAGFLLKEEEDPNDIFAKRVPVKHRYFLRALELLWDKVAFERIIGDALQVTGDCNGCGVCERLCPTGALAIKEGELIFKGYLCLQCGLCLEACPQKILITDGKITVNDVYFKREKVLTKIPVKDCEKCGKAFTPIRDEDLCLDCYTTRSF
ncbi:MAG: 4Fe-4S dicluster domain-containing protein [Bacillota bacterium]